MSKLSPQQEIFCAYLRGEKLTVVKAREWYHTTELRRCNSRLHKAFAALGSHIHGEKLVHDGKQDSFKTYRLAKSLQMEMPI